MKLEKTKKPFIRTIKRSKNKNHLNISIPTVLTKRLLTNNNYPKIYLDETNNLIFEKLEN